MTDAEQRAAAKAFAQKWQGKGYEKGESQKYWLSLLSDVFGVAHPDEFISFEDQVHLDHTSFIDGMIPSTRVMIEQKGLGKRLDKPIKQSDGSLLKPFEQAKRYITELPVSQHPRWVVTCNFAEFYIYDMERPQGEPEIIKLEDLEKEYYRLQFLVDTGNEHLKKEMEVSIAAGEIVGLLYDAFYKQYKQPVSEKDMRDLNVLCVRLVFCLYAEDAGIFGKRGMFHDYMARFRTEQTRGALKELFKVLDTKIEDRDEYLEDYLAVFPYVNGGLFAKEDVVIPQFTDEIRELILTKASENFDWSEISPTIFGAVFESTLNPETRRKGGMHYTSVENIHKVIDPLFLTDLKKEFEDICNISVTKTRDKKLRDFQAKLALLKFLDPACGSGNFLTETYLSLRRMENEIISLLNDGQIVMDMDNLIQVSISQFYGIEINDFAVTVAKTALWIAESQMMKETEDVVHASLDFLPLKTNACIVEGNALRMDWEDVVKKDELNYIMGNPPFVGQSLRSKQQSDDMSFIWGKGETETKLDYVICWYKKAIDYVNGAEKLNSNIKTAFVSTNSICQGESVPTFWKKMVDSGASIFFAYRTFMWDSEANEKAAVHCVIVGFTNHDINGTKLIFDANNWREATHINPYLLDAPDIWVVNRVNTPQSGLPKMTTGSPPTDDGALTLSAAEKDELEKQHPILKKYIKPFIGAREFLHDKLGSFSRYCLWFQGGNPSEYANIGAIKERFSRVKKLRESSNADRIQKMADYPYLFCQIRQPKTTYLVFPRHSSQSRRYIPIGFVSPEIIAGDACSIIPDVTKYEFGVLTSNVHNAWMRVVCGRIKSDFRYSPIVYNNFPWPSPTDEQKAKIEQTAQAILDARAKYPDCSLAELYDDVIMPPELRKAHQDNDRAVMQAYGFDVKTTTESSCVAELMKMYQQMTSKKEK